MEVKWWNYDKPTDRRDGRTDRSHRSFTSRNDLHISCIGGPIILAQLGAASKKKIGTFGWCPPQSGDPLPPSPSCGESTNFFCRNFFFILRIPWNGKIIHQTWKWNFPPPSPPQLCQIRSDLWWSGGSFVHHKFLSTCVSLQLANLRRVYEMGKC